MRIHADDVEWLRSSGLVDAEANLDRVSLHASGFPAWWVRRRGRSAITIGNHIWFSAPEKARGRPLLVHELVHVAQYRRMTVPVFIARYAWHLARNCFRYSRDLPFEAPAYARQAQARAMVDTAAAAHPDV
jgi:hypothetical protein